ncbi:MAG TPA: SGNH/GDSL hydrolase family protein [Streptosporangiaceae bacterium]
MTATAPAGRRAAAWLIRLGLLGAVALLVLTTTVAVGTGSRPAAAARGYDWVTSWTASPQNPVPGTLGSTGFHDQTVRDIIVPSVGGNMVRLELTNAFGRSPLQVGRVTVAVADLGAGVVPGTIHPVSFGGRVSVRIPAGEQVLSDPVGMQVPAMQELAVSIYLPGRTGVATRHTDALQVNWLSTAGDHVGEAGVGAFTIPTLSWYYLSGLDVRSSRAAGTVVAFGDSITDGVNSSVGGNDRWPDRLARRLAAVSGPTLAVADGGIGGNRLLTAARCCGASAQARFARDALDQPGVRDVIVLEGINDIGSSVGPLHSDTGLTPARVVAGYRDLIAQAHARGVRIFGATLLPYRGAGYYSLAGEAIREAVNAWIRTSGAFDGVIDFDAAMRDPADPLLLNPAYDSGDHLHPNDAGYQAMADAINLDMLLPHRASARPSALSLH